MKNIIGIAKDRIFVNTINEANSLKYKVNFTALTMYSALPSYIAINDNVTASNAVTGGLNTCRIKDGSIVGLQSYAVSTASGLTAFKNFIATDTSDCILLYTGSNFIASLEAMNYLNELGSALYFNLTLINTSTYGFAYCAVVHNKQICKEAKKFSAVGDSSRLEMEFTYDAVEDIASTGYAKAIIKMLSVESVNINWADVKLNVGDFIRITGNFTDGTKITFKDSDLEVELMSNLELQIPESSGLVIDSPATNLVITKISRLEKPINATNFGINGIRLNHINEVDAISEVQFTGYQDLPTIIELEYDKFDYTYRYNKSQYINTDPLSVYRLGVADYTDINGEIQKADPHVLRIDYTDGICNGILVDGEVIKVNLEPMTCTVYYKYKIENIVNSVYLDITNAIPSFTPPGFTSGWIQEIAIFKRTLTATEKNRRG